jgi:hypothetical protein
MPFVIAFRDKPHARRTSETPPYPRPIASLAAMTRRVRSSSSGHTDFNFRLSSIK